MLRDASQATSKLLSTLPVEFEEQPPLKVMNVSLHPRLQPKPAEVCSDQLVARHHRLHLGEGRVLMNRLKLLRTVSTCITFKL